MSRRLRGVARVAVAIWALAAGAPGAEAAPCGRPDLVEAFPDGDAEGVPTDAIFKAVYTASADYLGEDVLLAREDGPEEPVPASFDGNERTLTATPPEPLLPNTRYALRWPELRGRSSSAPGVGRLVKFTTGAGPDSGPPSFDGAGGVTWHLEREPNDCTGDIEERFVFDVTFPDATDDGGTASLALLLFQTKGPTIDGAPEPVALTHVPEPGKAVRIRRTTAEATGDVCFAAMVRDLRGQISGGADREVCTTTPPLPFFEGCGVAPHAPASLGAVAALALLGGLFARRRKTRSRRVVPGALLIAMLAASWPAPAAADPPEPASPEVQSAAPGAPAAAGETARPADFERPAPVRLALSTEGTRGFEGAGFYNQLAGARLDFRFSPRLTFGLYVGYANLKGPEGRAHNLLPAATVEYRLVPRGSTVSLPLRLATGLLPRNGPLMRGALGLAFPVGATGEIALLGGATAWVSHKEEVTSLDLGLEVSFPL